MQSEQRKLSKPQNTQRMRRGIYVLPNLFTTAALFFGFFAIIQGILGHYSASAIAVLIATVLDGLDGRVARLTKTSSDFGKEYDSLSDVVCFGLAPALVVFMWSLSSLGKLGWLCAFLYVSATALRLARFNIHSAPSPDYFQGLPCPMAAAFLITWMWVVDAYFGNEMPFGAEITTGIVVFLALGMVSSIPYLSFKNFGVRGRVPFITAILIVFAIGLISFDPPRVLFFLFFAYVLSGPAIWIAEKLNFKAAQPHKRHQQDETKDQSKE